MHLLIVSKTFNQGPWYLLTSRNAKSADAEPVDAVADRKETYFKINSFFFACTDPIEFPKGFPLLC